LTPLHLTLFSAGGSANHSLLATLLEFGADPWQALPFSSLALLHRLRAAVFPTGDPSASSQSSRLLMQHPQSAVAAYRDFMPANQKPGTLNDTCLSWSLFKLVLPLAVAVGNKDRVAVAQLLLRMQPAVNKRFSKKHHSGGSSAKGSSSSLGWLSTEKLTPSAAFTATDDDIPRCKLSLLLCPLVGDPEMAVHLLKSRCVHLLPTDPCGANALHLAIRAGDSQLARILLYFDTVDGDLMNMRGEGGWTALHEAISQRQLDLFRIMLRKGADASVRNDAGDTPRELGLKMGVNLNDLDCIWFGKP
jgi:ankyrin repeat protein